MHHRGRCCGRAVSGTQRSTSAFSLPEMLVVIAVIATLLAFLLPAIRGAREQAESTDYRSRLRQAAQIMFQYTADHDGTYLFCSTCGGPDQFYLNQSQAWHAPMERYGYPIADTLRWHSSGFSLMHYSVAHVARPSFFTEQGISNIDLVQGVRASDVRHPSNKSLFILSIPGEWDLVRVDRPGGGWWSARLSSVSNLHAANDGSVQDPPVETMVPPLSIEILSRCPYHVGLPTFGQQTVDGAHGRDWR
ncbi:MAG: type II secretion system protein [Planctomycetota bacterium]